MSEHTSTATENPRPLNLGEGLRQLAAATAFYVRAISVGVAETHDQFLRANLTAATTPPVVSEAETSMGTLQAEVKIQLDAMLRAVQDEIVEDGVSNAITRKLPELVADHYLSVLP